MINKGGLDVFSDHELLHAVSRNNIFYSRGRTYPRDSGAPPSDFRNDLTGGNLGGGLVRSMFLPSQVANPALGRGVRLPGFNDEYTGAAPDIGAFETEHGARSEVSIRPGGLVLHAISHLRYT
jgi:hypothetical protein